MLRVLLRCRGVHFVMSSESRDISCYSSAKKIRDSSTALEMTKKEANPRWTFLVVGLRGACVGRRLKENRNDQDGDNVHPLDHGIDRRPGCVLVRVAHGVARDRCGMRRRTFPAVMSFLDIFFGVVPRATAAGHGDGYEPTGHNSSDDSASQHAWAGLGNYRHQDCHGQWQ